MKSFLHEVAPPHPMPRITKRCNHHSTIMQLFIQQKTKGILFLTLYMECTCTSVLRDDILVSNAVNIDFMLATLQSQSPLRIPMKRDIYVFEHKLHLKAPNIICTGYLQNTNPKVFKVVLP